MNKCQTFRIYRIFEFSYYFLMEFIKRLFQIFEMIYSFNSKASLFLLISFKIKNKKLIP